MSQVTKKMFIEEYARQLIAYPSNRFKNMDRLGFALKYASVALDAEKPLQVHMAQRYKEWMELSVAAQRTCKALGIKKPTLDKLRALPKE